MSRQTQQIAPGPPPRWPIGQWLPFRREPVGFLMNLVRRYGDVARFYLGPRPVYLFTRPEHIRYLLVTAHEGYSKRTRSYRALRDLLGNGLLTQEGDEWAHARAKLQLRFTPAVISEHGATIITVSDRWIDQRRTQDRPLDLRQGMIDLAVEIAAAVLFGQNHLPDRKRLTTLVYQGLKLSSQRVISPYDLPGFLPGSRAWRVQRVATRLAHTATRLYQTGEGGLLQEAWKEHAADGNAQLVTMLSAGYEAIANLLSWFWYHLASEPDWIVRLRQEAFHLGVESSPAQRITRPLLQAALNETMRLHPPTWAIPRLALEDDRLDGVSIPASALVMISPSITHRHPAYWDDPDRFDPKRFLSPTYDNRSRHAFFPFGLGPRICIGKALAEFALPLIVTCLLPHIDLVVDPPPHLETEALLTLRPRGTILAHCRLAT